MRPLAQPGSGRRAAPITKPMEKRLRKAPARAAFLSGNSSGIIEAAERTPYTTPQMVPSNRRDIGKTSDWIERQPKSTADKTHRARGGYEMRIVDVVARFLLQNDTFDELDDFCA